VIGPNAQGIVPAPGAPLIPGVPALAQTPAPAAATPLKLAPEGAGQDGEGEGRPEGAAGEGDPDEDDRETWLSLAAIGRGLHDQARTIRVPVHMIEVISKIARTSRQMLNEIGREPTAGELAEKLGMPLEKVRRTLKIAREPLSTETPVGDEEDSHLGDFIEDKDVIQPIDAAIQSSLRDTIAEVLTSLTPREERIIRMRFGLGMTSDHTLEEVGNTFSVTRERIRQIEAKALTQAQASEPVTDAANLS